jgi:hypothetical protein
MFENYKLSLLDFFRIKKENHRLSSALENPGRDRLRRECIIVFLRKNSRIDQDLIRSVFDPTNQFDDQVRSIERFNLDRFRPLISFLTEQRNVRDERLVKLLAWLIDFPTYNEWRDLNEEELKHIFVEAAKRPEEKDMPEEEPNGSDIPLPIDLTENEEGKEPLIKPTPPPVIIIPIKVNNNTSQGTTITAPEIPIKPIYVPRFTPRYIVISCILLFFVGSTSFVVWERSITSVRTPNTDEKFMYWDGNHYEPVKAGEQEPGVTIIPLNIKILQQQRKITLPDTLTKYSLGKVWYKGYGKDHEYFTNSGIYPPDTSRRLKPLSSGILKHSSYDRYLLTRLIWFLCAAFFISLCGYGASTLKKEIKKSEEEKKVNEEETVQSHGNELQATSI